MPGGTAILNTPQVPWARLPGTAPGHPLGHRSPVCRSEGGSSALTACAVSAPASTSPRPRQRRPCRGRPHVRRAGPTQCHASEQTHAAASEQTRVRANRHTCTHAASHIGGLRQNGLSARLSTSGTGHRGINVHTSQPLKKRIASTRQGLGGQLDGRGMGADEAERKPGGVGACARPFA